MTECARVLLCYAIAGDHLIFKCDQILQKHYFFLSFRRPANHACVLTSNNTHTNIFIYNNNNNAQQQVIA